MSSLRGPTGQGNKIPTGYSQGQIQNYTPEQMRLFESLFSNLGPDSFLSKLSKGDQSTFDQIEAPAMRQFQGLQGQLASRFSGMGMGGRHSSGFQNASNQAASDFAQSLQSKRTDLQRNALKDLMGMSNELLGQRPYQQFLTEDQEEEKPFWQKILGSLLGLGGAGIGGLFGGIPGAKIGGRAGTAAGQAFF